MMINEVNLKIKNLAQTSSYSFGILILKKIFANVLRDSFIIINEETKNTVNSENILKHNHKIAFIALLRLVKRKYERIVYRKHDGLFKLLDKILIKKDNYLKLISINRLKNNIYRHKLVMHRYINK